MILIYFKSKFFQNHILKLYKQQQSAELKRLAEQKAEIQNRAEKLAEKCEDIQERQEKLSKRLDSHNCYCAAEI